MSPHLHVQCFVRTRPREEGRDDSENSAGTIARSFTKTASSRAALKRRRTDLPRRRGAWMPRAVGDLDLAVGSALEDRGVEVVPHRRCSRAPSRPRSRPQRPKRCRTTRKDHQRVLLAHRIRCSVDECGSIRPPSPVMYLVIPVQLPGSLRHRYCVGERLPGQHFAGSPTLSCLRAD